MHNFSERRLSERIVRMEIFTFGGGGRQKACLEYLSGISVSTERLILLPIPSTKDKIHIKGTDIPLSEIYPLIKEGCAVACYGLPESVREISESLGAFVIDAAKSEDFLLENADLTAEGALGVLLTDTDSSLGEKRIGIIGYGRIGSRLMRLLLFMGAKIRLYTRSRSLREELCREGIDVSGFSKESDYCGLDILINTAPVTVFSEERMKEYEARGLKILDLASGECFPPSANLKKLASVPEIQYPKTAGRLYGSFIEKALKEERL